MKTNLFLVSIIVLASQVVAASVETLQMAPQPLGDQVGQAAGPNVTGIPVALFHGIDDNCPNQANWTAQIEKAINYSAPVKCVEIGDGRVTSIFERVEKQVAYACQQLNTDPDFAGKEISIVGLSQGGLISRALVQSCEGLKVHTLFTFGGPHQGVSSYQKCKHWYCYILNWFVGWLAESDFAQGLYAPAEYFRPFWDMARFFDHASFLAYINNEVAGEEVPEYKERLTSVKNVGLFMWTEDMVVFPKESSWFGLFDESRDLILARDTEDYQKDLIGLKTLDEAGKLFFYMGHGNHMHFEEQYIYGLLAPLLLDDQSRISKSKY